RTGDPRWTTAGVFAVETTSRPGKLRLPLLCSRSGRNPLTFHHTREPDYSPKGHARTRRFPPESIGSGKPAGYGISGGILLRRGSFGGRAGFLRRFSSTVSRQLWTDHPRQGQSATVRITLAQAMGTCFGVQD